MILQETWLFDSEASFLSQIDREFYFKCISSMDTESGIVCGRPYGGLALFWRKSIGSDCRTHMYNDSRLLGLEITCNDSSLLIVNAYLPYCSPDNIEEYLTYLNKIDSIISASDTPYVIILGDLNADPRADLTKKVSHQFGKALAKYCVDENLIISDVSYLDNLRTSHLLIGLQVQPPGLTMLYVQEVCMP